MVHTCYGHWHLNESSGTIVVDSSGNIRDGTFASSGSWVSGKLNNCLQGDAQITWGHIASFERTDPFSLELWFYLPAGSQIQLLKMGSSDIGYFLVLYQPAQIGFELKGSNGTAIRIQIPIIFTPLTWYHIICTYDGTSTASGTKIYLNSILQTPNVWQDDLNSSILNSESLRSITDSSSSRRDEIVIYNRALSQTEVTFRYNSGNGTEDCASFLLISKSIFEILHFDRILRYENRVPRFLDARMMAFGKKIKRWIEEYNGVG